MKSKNLFKDIGESKIFYGFLLLGLVLVFSLFFYGRWYTFNEMYISFKGSYAWDVSSTENGSGDNTLQIKIDDGKNIATISMMPETEELSLRSSQNIQKEDTLQAGSERGSEWTLLNNAGKEEKQYIFRYKSYLYSFSGDENILKKVIANIVWK